MIAAKNRPHKTKTAQRHQSITVFGIHFDSIKRFFSAHEQHISYACTGDGNERNSALHERSRAGPKVHSALHHVSEADGDAAADSDGTGIADRQVLDATVAAAAVAVVETGVEGLVDGLPQHGVEDGGRGEDHAGAYGDVGGNKGCHGE